MQPTAILLPLDGRIPSVRRREVASTGQESQPWQRPYTSPLLNAAGDDDRAAWFHFCHGHHVEFLYWQVLAHACGRVTAALGAGKEAEADPWLARAEALIRGSGALLYFCGALDAEVYDRCLRPSMEAERDDFSGDMSREFLAMMDAKADMVEALKSGHDELSDRFHAAERVWYAHHGEVVHSLHPGKSLLREKVERLEHEVESFDYRAYVDNVVRSDQALSDYDDYFGVQRSDSITLDDYWTQALEKLATVHSGFAMGASQRDELMRGDAALLAVISELFEA
ncbi:MAG: L-tyrosine peroxygenase [Solirubrobacterales bacterium]|jgi:hypothetical protein|nr:L-tyrosine peroxygenase [Solirubrobacterales bacterium]